MKCPRDNNPLQIAQARPDSYVCLVCRGLFTAMPELLQKLDAASPGWREQALQKSSPLLSPYNGRQMYAFTVRGIELDYCQESGSVWFDGGELERLKKMRDERPDSGASDMAAGIAQEVFWQIDIADTLEWVWDCTASTVGKIGDLFPFN